MALGISDCRVWMRVPGDVVFAFGTVFLAWFAIRLLRGGKHQQPVKIPAGSAMGR